MKHLQLIAIVFFFSISSFALGTMVHKQEPQFGSIGEQLQDAIDDKNAVVTENIELHTRLKETETWDPSIVSAQELSQAFINVANNHGVTEHDIEQHGNNIQAAIQTKLGQESKLCSDPNSTSIDPKNPKGKNVANP